MAVSSLGAPLNQGASNLSNQVLIASGSCVIPANSLVIAVLHQRAAAALTTDAMPSLKDESNNPITGSSGSAPDVQLTTGETRTTIFSAYYASGATHTFTGSWTSATANVNDTRLSVFAVSGAATSAWLDVTGTQGNGSALASTTATSGNVASNSSLAVWAATYFNASATGTAPTNYTDRANNRDVTRGMVAHVADLTPLTSVGAPEQAAYTPAGASGNNHSTVLAVYKQDTGGALGSPVNTVVPAVTGTFRKGSTVTTDNGTWTNTPTSFAYQWQRDTAGNGTYANIATATTSSYTLVQADVINGVRCVVTATNATGSNSANSNATRVGGFVTGTFSGGLEVCGNAGVGLIGIAGQASANSGKKGLSCSMTGKR